MAGTPDFANWVLYLAKTCTEEDSLRPFHEALANLTIDEEEDVHSGVCRCVKLHAARLMNQDLMASCRHII